MHLPNALPDETLFSRIVRYLSLSGTPKEQCLKDLVGNRRAVIHPYLTADLTAISSFTNESARELYWKQTLRPLFAYYLPRYEEKICDCSIRTNELVRTCQLTTFRECEPLTVKYCPLCAIEDIQRTGIAYWHCSHQIPGVEACSNHGVWLSHQPLNDREHVRSSFFPIPKDNPRPCEVVAVQFAKFAETKRLSLQTIPRQLYDSIRYKYQLADKGFATNTGRIKRIELMKALYELSHKLLPFNNPLCIKLPQDFRYISSLLEGSHQTHPFKHLLLEFFLIQIQRSEDMQIKETTSNTEVSDTSELEARCCVQLLNGSSMAQVGREIGKSRCYVKSVALKHCIPVNLMPYKITAIVKNEVIKMAFKGVHRSSIAQKFGISTGSVEMIISSTEGLVEWRKKCKLDSRRRRYQCQLLRYFQMYPHNLRQSVKEECSAAFFWLYLNYPGWLEQHLPEPQKKQNVAKIDWKERDKKLSTQIVRVLESVGYVMSRSELERELNVHGWLTSKKEKLPLTMAIYYKYCELKN
ncbi:TniQ family protein [Vibrio fluvialis]|nr:TniQ family protein [Vibrio fluvialis]ELP2653811.1 TniQ family protein [Vibrio fluvialis]